MRTLPFFIALIFFGLYLNAQKSNCLDTSENWNSEKEVISGIENINFKTSESISLEKSSWMKSAHYYTCDDKFGHLIIKCERKSFIHKNVPISVWQSLKVAKSVGRFYDHYIKDKYKIVNPDTVLAIL